MILWNNLWKVIQIDISTVLFPLWLSNLLLNLTSLPVAYKLFGHKKVKTYPPIFASFLGLMGTSYINFVATSMKPQIFTLTRVTLFESLGVWIGINALIFLKASREQQREILRTPLKKSYWAYNLAVILISLGFYALKGLSPEIINVERTMSIGILEALKHTTTLPPNDFWLAGKKLNYYYFGHFMAFSLLRITNIALIPGFYAVPIWMYTNLALFTFHFGKTLNNLIQRGSNKNEDIWAGILSTIFVFGGTIYGLIWLAQSVANLVNHGKTQISWFATAMRPNDYTFLDTPLYSMLFHELHAHTWGFLIGILILNILIMIKETKKQAYALWIGLLLGISWMTNTWDVLTLGFLSWTALLAYTATSWKNGVAKALLYASVMLGTAYTIALPWRRAFHTPIGTPKIVEKGTPLAVWLGYWAIPLIAIGIFLAYAIKIRKREAGLLLQINTKPAKKLLEFLLPVFLVAGTLLAIVEIVAVQDVLVKLGGNNRFNTFWKISVQVWIWLTSLTGVFFTQVLISEPKEANGWRRRAGLLAMAICFIGSSAYTVHTLEQGVVRNRQFTGISHGNLFWSKIKPDEYQVYKMLKNTERGDSCVIAEANGASYTATNFLAPFLGCQNVLGWDNHELTWRGDMTDIQPRYNDLTELYECSGGQEHVKEIIKKYKINYIVVSQEERKRYKINEECLKSLGKMIYRKPTYLLIQLE